MKKMIFPASNGIVLQFDDKKVFSATDCDGKKKLLSFKEPNKVIFWHFPFIRGIQYFFCGIFALFQTFLLSFDICSAQKIKNKDLNRYYIKQLIFICGIALCGMIASAIILGLLPGKFGFLIVGISGQTILRNFVILMFKLFFFYLFIVMLRIFPMVNELLKFNKAGQDVLNSKKYNKDKNIKKTQKKSRLFSFLSKNIDLEPNFLNFFIFVFVLDFIVITLWGADYGFWFNLLLNFAILILCAGVAYEMLLFISTFKGLEFLQYLTAFLVFSKPTTTHIETVNVALTELNLLNTQKDREFMTDDKKKSFSVVYNEVKNRLQNAGINEKSDADWIIANVLDKNRAEIKLLSFITDKQYQDIIKATERRAKGESIDNIFGFTEFYGLRFDVNKKVLTPRMETEILVETVLKVAKPNEKTKILDLGTGSGAIAVALAKNCDASITALDISKSALAIAESNAKKNGVEIEFLHSNLFDNLKRKRKFDIIVSNPPYIPTQEIEKLDRNVRDFDPHIALDGGEDGLDFYRKIVEQSVFRLNDGGYIFFEVGKGQAKSVKQFLKDAQFEEIKIVKDYSKIERVVYGKRK